ncbi:MAG TPA: cyanophycin synthetase, partial [Rhizomicrobium sp.]
ITYGFNPQADVRASNVTFSQGSAHFDAAVVDRRTGETIRLGGLDLPMPGEHNVQNALAAIAVAQALGIEGTTIRNALARFSGVNRRFTRVGEWNGAAIIDDYAHNPFKIAAALKAARQAYSGPLIAIVQPHRYTRLRDTFEQFSTCLHDADTAVVAPVYPAGEQPIAGIDRDAYANSLRAHGHRHVMTIDGPRDLPKLVAALARPGGAIVFLGAGSITQWAAGLEPALRQQETAA